MNNHTLIDTIILIMVVSDIGLLFIFFALGLAVGAVPVHQHHQGQHEHTVGDQDSVQDGSQCLRPGDYS